MISTKIRLNTLEAENFEWAMWGTVSHFENDLNYDDIGNIFFKKNNKWHIDDNKKITNKITNKIIDDIIYRLDIMLPEIADAAVNEKKAKANTRAAKRVTQKLKNIKETI